jgi:hypothetical protein
MAEEPNPEILDRTFHVQATLPHYPGLARPEDRHVADEVLRRHIAAVVEELLHHLESVEVHLARQGQGPLMPAAARVRQTAETVADKTQLASYGFSPFFSSHRTPEDRLLAVLYADCAIVDAVEALVKTLAKTLRPDDDLAPLLEETERLLAHLDDRIEARINAIMALH